MTQQPRSNPIRDAQQRAAARLITAGGWLGAVALVVVATLLIAGTAIALVWGFAAIPDKGPLFAQVVRWIAIAVVIGLGGAIVAFLIGIGITVAYRFRPRGDDEDLDEGAGGRLASPFIRESPSSTHDGHDGHDAHHTSDHAAQPIEADVREER